MSATPAQALAQPPDGFDALASKTVDWLAAATPDAPRRILTLGDPAYPLLLLDSADPPLLLYTLGRVDLLGGALAVVGSRNPTAQGRDNARAFAAQLSRTSLTIVSGLPSASMVLRMRAGLTVPDRRSRWSAPGSISSIHRATKR